MLKKNIGTMILTSLLILLPMVVGLILWNSLPEQLPVHWNAEGQIDGYGSRALVSSAFPA